MSRKKVYWTDRYFDPKTHRLLRATNYYGVLHNLSMSKKEGVEYEYYPSGGIKYITPYKKGLQEGVEEHYNEKGVLIGVYSWHKGELSGKSVEYYDNGAIKWERQWKKGFECGEHIKYRLDSSMAQRFFYKNGKLCTSIFYDGYGNLTKTIDYTTMVCSSDDKSKIIV